MAEFPALPLFTDSLLADTHHLSETEFGAYLKILILIWRSPGCRVPADAAWHMRKLGVDSLKYKELYEPLFSEFLLHDGSFVTQKRLKREYEYLVDQRLKKRGAAKSRWNKEKTPDSAYPSAYAPTPTPTPPSSEAKASSDKGPGNLFEESPKTKKPKSDPVTLPTWLPHPVWQDWRSHRHSLRKPLTHRAEALCLSQLTEFQVKGHDPVAIINQSIMNGWQGLFEPKQHVNGHTKGRAKKETYSDEIQGAMARAMHNMRKVDDDDEIPY